jgi:multidrug efflux pump subunit AcrA (membrane-fusion protein)
LVDESNISSVLVGNPAAITFDSLIGVTLAGHVSGIQRIGQTVNGLVKYTVVVSVDPTDKPVLFGATANVVITTGAPHKSLAVPVLAVMNDTQGEYILVISADGTRTNRVNVQSGDLSGNLVTISTSEDLKEGDQVELGTGSSSSSGGGGFGGGGGGGFGGPGGGG